MVEASRDRSQSNASRLSNPFSLSSFDTDNGVDQSSTLESRRQARPRKDIDLKEIDEVKRYEDFSTIDWVEEAARENLKRRLKIQRLRELNQFSNDGYYEEEERGHQRSGSFISDTDFVEGIDEGLFDYSEANGGIQLGQLRRKKLRLKKNGNFFQRQKFKWKTKLSELFSAAQAWIILTLIGCVLGSLAGSVNITTKWLADIKTGHCSVGFYLNKEFCCPGQETCPEWKSWTGFFLTDYFAYTIISVFFAFTAAYFVKCFAPYAAGSGISEIKCIIAGFVMKGFLGFPTLAIKSLALPLTIASGLSVGKEGPSVHYAVCVGNVIGSMFEKYRNNSKMREILSACTAAGVATAFGSPMGGVLFSIEEVSSTFQIKTMWRSYFCALVATGVLAGVNAFRTGQIVVFSVSYDYDWHFFEIIFFIILGIFGGCFGIFLIKWNLRVQGFRKKYLGNYAIQEVIFLSCITAMVCYFNPILKLDMTESMQWLFRECENGFEDQLICDSSKRGYALISLIFAIVIRTVLVIVSYGAKVPAGIFVPSMAIGAIFGRIVGTFVEILHDSFPNSSFFASCPPDGLCITPGTYAFLGAGAALSGVLHITVTVVIIMYELTGALNYIVPTMIVVGITNLIGDRWGKGGITDQAIWFNGFPFIDTKEEHRFNAPASEAMAKDIVALPATGMTLDQLQTILSETNHSGFPIIEDENSKYLIGYIRKSEIQYVIENKRKKGKLSPTAKCYFASAAKTTQRNTIPSGSRNIEVGSSENEDLFSLGDDEEEENNAYVTKHDNNLFNNDTTLSLPTSSTTNLISDNYNDSSSSNEINSIDFERFVNFTPIVVSPLVALETVMEIFSHLGPSVVIVEYHGRLCGLMSRKDILRYQFKVEHTYAPRERELNRTAAEQVDQQVWETIQWIIAVVHEKLEKFLPSWFFNNDRMNRRHFVR